MFEAKILMKVSLDAPIIDAIHPQLEHQVRGLDLHVELEIQIVELDPLGRRQAGEQALGHGVEVGGQGADFDEVLAERVRGVVELASDEVVFNNERLARPEVAGVVEGDGLVSGYGRTL